MPATHTPGPWSVVEVGVDEFFIVKSDPGGGWEYQICEMSNDGDMANANLIKTAPNLLKALIDVVNLYTSVINESGECRWDPEKDLQIASARMAIADALKG